MFWLTPVTPTEGALSRVQSTTPPHTASKGTSERLG